MRPTREDAWKLLNEHVTTDSLIKHALPWRPPCVTMPGNMVRMKSCGR